MIFFFFIGSFLSASIASFYVTLADRIILYFYGDLRKAFTKKEKWKEIFFKPSHCESCGKEIPILYLTPILGYIISIGKCFHCKAKLEKKFLITEISASFVFCYSFFFTEGFSTSLILMNVFGLTLVFMLTDFSKLILDFEILFFLVPLGILVNYFLGESIFDLQNLYLFLGFLFVFGILHLAYKKGMGFGDVLFAPSLALLSGHPYWMIFLNVSTITAIGHSLVSKIILKKKNWKEIPFGFYMGLGFILSMLAKLQLLGLK
ncbi:MAG: prepilin peptidase [Leptospiraceae bacterium]|nr:prepilin peptidase [Leptospiraceae bacterium]